MITLTKELLRAAIPVSEDLAELFMPSLLATTDCSEITTPERLAAFLAQVGHESGMFREIEESLLYSKAGLLLTFPKHFDEATAEAYERKPVKIGSRVYANRMGNGDEASGDGYKYRGRGLIQVTGHDNYAACGMALGMDLIGNPDMLLQPKGASRSAGWFWDTHKLNDYADRNDFKGMTLKINGGLIGYDERVALWQKAKKALGVA